MSKKGFSNKNNNYNFDLENEIINKINELYITYRQKYLVLSKEGKYYTKEVSKGDPKLNDGFLRKHLRGQETYGVFSGIDVTKFLAFDVDFENELWKAKQVTYLIRDILVEIGFDYSDIHISFSGKKGYHVLLFFEPTQLSNTKMIFDYVKNKLYEYIDEETISASEIKRKIEMRVNHGNGMKLELGGNFSNSDKKTNRCWFVDDNLKPIEDMSYILGIKQIDKDKLLLILDEIKDGITESNIEIEDKIKQEENMIKNNIKEPYSHKLNRDEPETIENIKDILINGMRMSGTRNNCVFQISKLFLYMGLELDEAIEELKDWMTKQPKQFYSISLEDALSECKRVCATVYEKSYKLVGDIENLYIYKSEIKKIINIKEKNAKILFFAMLLHSKRYSNKQNVFYMTFKQMEEMCGIGIKGASNNIEILERLNLLEVVERNVKRENSFKSKPNKYRIKMEVEKSENDIALEIDNTSSMINYLDLYYITTVKLLDNKEIRHLPRKQYEEFKKYRLQVS